LIKFLVKGSAILDNILGIRIKSLRQKANMTQIELSQKLNVSNTTLSQYENGIRIPSDDIKLKIADYFDVSVDYLLGNSSNKKIKTAPNEERPISQEKQNLLKLAENLDIEELKKVLEYAELIKLRRNL